MATIKAGTYVFKSNVSLPTSTITIGTTAILKSYYLTANNTYIDTPVQISSWDITSSQVSIILPGGTTIANSWITRTYDASAGQLVEYTATDTTKLRTIIAETDQTVSDDFYTWFSANIITTSKLSVDLTTLPGWANLSSGNHVIKLKAKGSNYRDSELSVGVTVSKPEEVYTDCLTFTGESSEFTLAVGSAGAKEWDGTLYYSTDHNTWNVWDGTAISSANKKLYLRGKGNTKFYTSKGACLSLSARAGCSGNIQTLLDYETPLTVISADKCYKRMFYNCTSLISAPSLPATTLATECYDSMFYGCTSLTTAPELPATTLTDGCYISMFNSCTNLTTAPELPATTLKVYCYYTMFSGCTKLKVNDSSGNKIFMCPTTIPTGAVTNMFTNTGGTFTGTPFRGTIYYWTE